jgi:hypothetical protein
VTQTINNCESEKLAITVTLSSNTIPAKNVSQILCNDTSGNTMAINLHSYEASIINTPGNYIFTYTDAAGNAIANPSAYVVNLGTTVISVKVATTDGCFTIVRLTLTINPKPFVNFLKNWISVKENLLQWMLEQVSNLTYGVPALLHKPLRYLFRELIL